MSNGTELELRYWDDPVLSQPCESISHFDENLSTLALQMYTLMQEHKGIGLAAPQVGKLISMFVMQVPGGLPMFIFNPTCVPFGNKVTMEEGCLSLPDVYSQVERPESAHIQFQDLEGATKEITLHGLEARVAQHEVDHLCGIMFFERLSRQMKRAVLREWGSKRV